MRFVPSWQKMRFIGAFWLMVVCSPTLSVWGKPTRYEYCRWSVENYDCPEFEDTYWECLRDTASCPVGTQYHCARRKEEKSKFIDGCVESRVCYKGESPFLTNIKDGEPFEGLDVICDKCYNNDWYNSEKRNSSSYSDCKEVKVRCDPKHGIECEPDNPNDKYKQNRLCRCDARKGYVVHDIARLGGEICSSDRSLVSECVKAEPCGNNEERLLNYTCAHKCINGYRIENSDECVNVPSPHDDDDTTSSTSNSSFTIETSTSTTTSTSTASSTRSSKSSSLSTIKTVIETTVPTESSNDPVLLLVLAITFGVLFIVSCTGQSVHEPAKEPLLKTDNYYVQICVTSEEYTDAIAKARPYNIPLLDITKKLETALRIELSSIPAVKNVTVIDFREGSLLVQFVIETENLTSPDDLNTYLKEMLKRGLSEFSVSSEKYKFDNYSALCPLPRRPSVQDTTHIESEVENDSPLQRRKRIKRAHSLPTSFSNGHVPKADAELSMLDDSGYRSYKKSPRRESVVKLETLAVVHETKLEAEGAVPPISPVKYKPSTSQPRWRDEQTISPRGSFKQKMFKTAGRSMKIRDTDDEEKVKERLSKEESKEEFKQRQGIRPVNRRRRMSSSSENLIQWVPESPVLLKKCYSEQYLQLLDTEELDMLANRVLSGFYEPLIYSLQPDAILDKFVKYRFLRELEIRNIREQRLTSEKNRMIIDVVKSRGYEGYKKFKKIIKDIQLELSRLDEDELRIAKDMKAHPENYSNNKEEDHDSDAAAADNEDDDDDDDDDDEKGETHHV